MTRQQAVQLLGIQLDSSAAETRRRYQELYSEYQLRLTNAPTLSLKKLYEKNLHEVKEAYQLLIGAETKERHNDFPMTEPIYDVSPKPQESRPKPKPPISETSSLHLKQKSPQRLWPVVAIIALVGLGGIGWFFFKSPAKGKLFITTDADCIVYIDNVPSLRLGRGQSQILPVKLGEHLIRAESSDKKDRWQNALQVENSDQIVVNIMLQAITAQRLANERASQYGLKSTGEKAVLETWQQRFAHEKVDSERRDQKLAREQVEREWQAQGLTDEKAESEHQQRLAEEEATQEELQQRLSKVRGERERLQREAEAKAQKVVTFEKTYGGEADDWGSGVQLVSDGGYIIVGTTQSAGADQSDIYLLKIDARGNLQWQKNFGGSDTDEGEDVQTTSDGGYIIVGSTASRGAGQNDVYLIKTNSRGNLQWQRTFGGANEERGDAVLPVSDGGYIVVGTTASQGTGGTDVYVLKVDADGDLLWEKNYGGENEEWGNALCPAYDGGYIIAGQTASWGEGKGDVYLFKIDTYGNRQWQKTFGGRGDDKSFDVQALFGGGRLIVGNTNSMGAGHHDVYLIKTDARGNLLWQKAFGGAEDDQGLALQVLSDNSYIIAGETTSWGAGMRDICLFKVDVDGNLQWQKTYGGIEDDGLPTIRLTTDGGLIIAGGKDSPDDIADVYVLKTDARGNLVQ